MSLIETASQSHLRILREEKSCDVIFFGGSSSERIQCHKSFLTARSTVFEAMLSDRGNNNETNVQIRISDIEPVTFRKFLEVRRVFLEILIKCV